MRTTATGWISVGRTITIRRTGTSTVSSSRSSRDIFRGVSRVTERLLITGATGFVGRCAAAHWRERRPDVEVWGTSDRPRTDDYAPERYRQLDLRDGDAMKALVKACRPTRVLHLASLIAGHDLEALLSVNVLGTDRLYEALASAELPNLRIVQVASAAMYGRIGVDELPITEKQPFRPVTAYAVSKVAQEYLAIAAGYAKGLSIVRARAFNMLGPGQPEHLVPMTFVRQVKSVADGDTDRIRVGLTSARRDFVDVRDAVAAFDLMLEKGTAGTAYNVASGTDVSVDEIIREVLDVAGVEARIEVDESRLRPVDVPVVRADITEARRELGWQPKVPLRRSLEDMWREVS
ncbi:MAG: NAD-dependent epimerase/dehydratase family protein [Candidatus Eisenbacteria bacterium]|nr:NAD-dependent epimerase/dehydratase family protein [Candidatus Eisenbacteria bacterium]